jgi:putative membrane protein
MKMSEPRRLHPLSALLSAVRSLRELLFPLAILLISGMTGGQRDAGDLLWRFGSAGAVIIATFVWGVLSWRRYRYCVEDGELRVEHGVLIKKRNFISRQRIQAIDFVEPLLHRLFRVVQVRIETAGGQKPEALLTAVTREEAERLKHELMHKPKVEFGEEKEEVRVEKPDFVYRLPKKRVLAYGATSGGIGVALSLLGAVFSQLDDVLPYEKIFGYVSHFVFSTIFVIAVLALFVAWFLSIGATVLKYSGFTLTKSGDNLFIVRGLLERRQLTVPLKRIQAVRIVEGILRQPFGLVTVQVDTAGYGAKKAERIVLFPLLRREEVDDMLERAVPGFYVDAALTRLPRRAGRRYMVRAAFFVLLAALGASCFVPEGWGYYSFLLVPIAVWFGWWRYRSGGWALDERNVLVIRTRRLSRTTGFLPRGRIQFAGLRQSPFQRSGNLVSYMAVVASGSRGALFTLHDMEEENGAILYEWMHKRK